LEKADQDQIGRFSVSLCGLPAAAKSTVVATLLRNGDHIVVPTRVLQRAWRRTIAEQRLAVQVSTQHWLLNHPPINKIRLLVVDEAYLLESAHFSALASFAEKTIAIGDTSQIVGFHVRGQAGHYAVNPEHAEFMISAPFSLHLPLPVLLLGKRLGFVKPEAVTMNHNGVLDFSSEPASATNEATNHFSIVFNQAQKNDNCMTAHDSEGSRCRTADVTVTYKEEYWVPFSGHFWVAVSRATHRTTLHLSIGALASLRSALEGVCGFGTPTFNLPAHFDVLRPKTDTSFITAGKYHLQPALLPVVAERSVVADSTTQTSFSIPVFYHQRTVAAVTFAEVADALLAINLNVNQLGFSDVVDVADVNVPRDLASPLAYRLDLQSDHRGSSSILPPAGVFFSARDTKTEIYTIAERYLANAPYKDDNPVRMAQLLLASFDRAYLKPDCPHISVDGSAALLEWFHTRKEHTFNLNPFFFGEAKTTTEFQSFLKAHAKAKNDVGYGLKMEKGQTIAAGDESYNSRFTALARQLQTSLQSVLADDMILDIGYSDAAFAHKARSIGLGSQTNTQIDLSSQDSTHRQAHVLALISLLRRYTDATEEECSIYYQMRKSFRVRARNFNTDQVLIYSQNWTLPSGDPFTLIANCIHEMTSTGYVFALTPEIRGPGAAKGDDQLYNGHLSFGPPEQARAKQLGVKFKIDYDLPPFFAGRLILPTGVICYDPVKITAKYSVKNIAPENTDEMLLAYATMLEPISLEDKELLVLALGPHHPTMTTVQIRVALDFAFSLWNRDFFLRFQKTSSRQCFQFVDESNDCVKIVLKSMNYPSLAVNSPSADVLREHLIENYIPHIFLPHAPRVQLRFMAQRNPNCVVFNYSHCVGFVDTAVRSAHPFDP
jgi:hypothetical protein